MKPSEQSDIAAFCAAIERASVERVGNFIASATEPWRCPICRALIFPAEVHRHDGPLESRS